MYGLRYYSNFTNIDGQVCRLEILKKDYTGTTSEMLLGSNPVVMQYSGRNRFEPILSCGLNLEIVEQSFLQYSDLIGVGELEHKVVLKRNGLILFQGFIVPELYENNFSKVPEIVYLSASDHLQSLQNKKINLEDGPVTLLKIITDIIKQTGLELDLYINNSLIEEDFTIGQNIYQSTFIDTRSFQDNTGEYLDSLEILSSILKSTGSRICQIEGRWHIFRINDLDLTTHKKYTFPDYNVSTNVNLPVQIEGLPWVESSQKLSLRAGKRIVELTKHTKKLDNLVSIRNLNNIIEGGSPPAATTMIQWVKDPSFGLTYENGILEFDAYNVNSQKVASESNNWNDFDYVRWDALRTKTRFTYMASRRDRLIVSFRARPADIHFHPNAFNFFILRNYVAIIQVTILDRWGAEKALYINSANQVELIPKPFTAAYPNPIAYRLARYDVENHAIQNDDLWFNFNFTFDLSKVLGDVPFDSSIELHIRPLHYQYSNNAIEDNMHYAWPVDSLMTDIQVSYDFEEEDNVIEAEINPSYIEEEKVTMYASDLSSLNYINAFQNWQGIRTKAWKDARDPNYFELAERIIRDYIQMFHKARKTLSGIIKTTALLNPMTLFTESMLPGQLFHVNGLSYNMKSNTWDVQIDEFENTENIVVNG